MATEKFDYTCFINVPPALIYEYLSEPDHYRGLQPLVVAVYDVVSGQNAQGQATYDYVAVEHIRFFGFIPYNNPIRVHAALSKPGETLINDVQARFSVRLQFVTTLQNQNGGTQVSETVTVHVPRLMQGYVVGQAKFAQHARFMNLKNLLENDYPTPAGA